MLQIHFEWLDFAFKCFKSFMNGSNLYMNSLNPFRIFRICIQMLQIWLKWLEFAFESLSNASNASNPFQMLTIW